MQKTWSINLEEKGERVTNDEQRNEEGKGFIEMNFTMVGILYRTRVMITIILTSREKK